MASASANPVLEYAETALNDITSTRYALAASLVVIFYDWFLSLNGEIQLIWPARRSIVKTIFLANRYFAPVLLVWANYAWSGHALWFKPISCRAYLLLDSCLIITIFASLHYIVSLRAWALYGKSRTVGIILWGSFVVYLAAAFATTIKGLMSIPFSLFPIVDICFGTLPTYLWAIWLPSIVFETLVFGLTVYKAIQIQGSTASTPVLSTLFRDGFLYFLFISINSAVNLLFWAFAPATKVLLVKYLSTAVTVAAGSHLILDLREVGHLSTQQSINSNNHPFSHGPTNVYSPASYQMRRYSAAPRTPISPIFPEHQGRGEKLRLVAPWENRSHENMHSYPPSPLSYNSSPISPSGAGVRFAQNV